MAQRAKVVSLIVDTKGDQVEVYAQVDDIEVDLRLPKGIFLTLLTKVAELTLHNSEPDMTIELGDIDCVYTIPKNPQYLASLN